jgi:hypothetical protein
MEFPEDLEADDSESAKVAIAAILPSTGVLRWPDRQFCTPRRSALISIVAIQRAFVRGKAFRMLDSASYSAAAISGGASM